MTSHSAAAITLVLTASLPAAMPQRAALDPGGEDSPCIVQFDRSRPAHAVWDDGVFLMWPLPDREGFCLIGRYDPAQMASVLDIIEKCGFLTQPTRNYVVPDSDWTEIYARHNGHEARWAWHGYINPGFGGDLNDDALYRQFIARWRATEGAIMSLAPIEVHRYNEAPEVKDREEFRGIRVHDPVSSHWPPH